MVKDKIRAFCNSIGLDVLGFTKCRVFEELEEVLEKRQSQGLQNEFEEKDIKKRINPFFYMKEGKTILSIAFPYNFDSSSEKKIYFSKYTRGSDYHKVVGNYLEKICKYIEGLGGEAIPFVDSNALPERYIAMLCGVGFIGKNNMLITEKYGSYVFLGEIITDLNLEGDVPFESKCKACEICLRACPTVAIGKTNRSNFCLSYITQKKEVEEQWFSKFEGRIFGCDTCQNGCPFNQKVSFSSLEEFRPYSWMEKIEVEELLNLDNKTFKEKYSSTSCGWRGKNILKRNALIANFMSEVVENKEFKGQNSPYLQDYYDRLLKRNKL